MLVMFFLKISNKMFCLKYDIFELLYLLNRAKSSVHVRITYGYNCPDLKHFTDQIRSLIQIRICRPCKDSEAKKYLTRETVRLCCKLPRHNLRQGISLIHPTQHLIFSNFKQKSKKHTINNQRKDKYSVRLQLRYPIRLNTQWSQRGIIN